MRSGFRCFCRGPSLGQNSLDRCYDFLVSIFLDIVARFRNQNVLDLWIVRRQLIVKVKL